MKFSVLKILALTLAVSLYSLSAMADPIAGAYDASDAAGNCNEGPHGLWTNNHTSGSTCSNYFGVDDLTVELIDGATDANNNGTILGWVENPDGISAFIDITFSGWLDDIAAGYKDGGGAKDATQQDFYSTLMGTITIDSVVYTVSQMAGTYVQVGWGANDKSAAFGLSTWLSVTDADGNPLDHWDINIEMTSVPEPATLALFGLGLLGAGAARRKPRRS